MKLDESDFKMKISLRDVPRVELVEAVKQPLSINQTKGYHDLSKMDITCLDCFGKRWLDVG